MRDKTASVFRRLAAQWHRSSPSQQARRHATDASRSSIRHTMLHGPPVHTPTPEEAAATARRNAWMAAALLSGAGAMYAASYRRAATDVKPPKEEHLVNWSGTHECEVRSFYQPETQDELEALVRQAHAKGQKIRCIGSGLSPNALSFEAKGMVSLALLDKILKIDPAAGVVTVQAGARVQDVANALRPHGLTLQNYASIREQTIGGFTQVSAHGTGAAIPPVDDAVIGLKLVTPALGTLELSSRGPDPELFALARVGLGCLGVVSEVTLQCVPAHKLVERTFVSTSKEVRRRHSERLQTNKHLRYMWIPSTDAVVVVQCNEAAPSEIAAAEEEALRPGRSVDDRLQPLRALAESRAGLLATADDDVAALSATQLRDALLAVAPLDPAWVKKVNAAEAEYWRRSSGVRVGWSDEILGFDCGGQQWVLEVAFPAGTRETPSGADLDYMKDLLAEIESENVAAPAPIEQRWTAGSASPMSPSAGAPNSLHSWVGIIMYLPENQEIRDAVTASFKRYGRLAERSVMRKYGAVEHWAKIEVPESAEGLEEMRARLAARYPLQAFAQARKRLDPKNILGNTLVDTVLSVE